MKALGASTRLFELLDRNHNPASENAIIPSPNVPKTQDASAIRFDHVYFRYPTRPNNPILSNLCLDIQPNETVAIVGPSGCGKTTISELLGRFYAPDGGECEYVLNICCAYIFKNMMWIIEYDVNI